LPDNNTSIFAEALKGKEGLSFGDTIVTTRGELIKPIKSHNSCENTEHLPPESVGDYEIEKSGFYY
jgi:hypothetical protein